MATGQRTKGMRQKTGTNEYDVFVPFGSDGKYIDMDSSLDLEEELKLGGSHYVTINEDENITSIIENYAGGYKTTTDIIEDENGITISSKLYKNNNFLHRKNISIIENGAETTIEETLYNVEEGEDGP